MKQSYEPPVLTVHEKLRDITSATSGRTQIGIPRTLISQPRAPRL